MDFDEFIENAPFDPWTLMNMGVSLQPISGIFQELPSLKQKLESFHPLKSASIAAGLLSDPAFHANTLRLELLVQLFVAYSRGSRQPSTGDLDWLLNRELGSSSFSLMEDPIEDVFISNVTTSYGNRRIFEGTWESSDYYLQRILNVIETLPDDQDTILLLRQVHAQLRVSDEIADRLGLERYCQGSGEDNGKIRIPSAARIRTLKQAITFSHLDLARLGISPADLTPFIFQPSRRDALKDQEFGDNNLIRYPLVCDEENWVVLLPSAISVAIRQHVLMWMCSKGYQDSFDKQLVMEYRYFFREAPIFGSAVPKEIPLPSKKAENKVLFDVSREVDKGRYVHFLAVVDSISSYQSYGFLTPDHDPTEISNILESRINTTQNHFRKIPGFKKGLTLIIGCGYGRPTVFYPPEKPDDWMIEFVSAPDFQSLSWIPGASSLSIWKLIEHESFLKSHNVSIANANGLLNLYGWWVNSEHFIIHPDIYFPDDQTHTHIAIPTDCLADIRLKVRRGWDLHALPSPDGQFVRVQRTTAQSYFPDDKDKPQYAAIDAARSGQLLVAWVGDKNIWWLTAEHDNTGLSRDLVYRTWDAVSNWMERAVPVIEHYTPHSGSGILSIALDFNNAHQEQEKPIEGSVLKSSITVLSDKGKNSIRISFQDPFFAGFRNPKNIAERTILRKLVEGYFSLISETTEEQFIEKIIDEIVPDDNARYLHFFEAIHFRDHIHLYDRAKKLFIDDAEVARSKLGLGWMVQDRNNGNRFVAAPESVAFLNSVVGAIWKRMQPCLHSLDRKDFIKRALWHLEGVEADKKRWQRTIRAVLALRSNKEATKFVAMKQIARCNASELALRLLIEMAISECPLTGGNDVGKLDLTPLMSDILMIFHFGGCSDAINKGVMEPEVRIAPCGDVLTHTGFQEEVANPMGEHFESVRLDHEADQYEKNYQEFRPVPTVIGSFDVNFLAAFEDEFGFSIDTLRLVRETFEDLAIEKESCVFVSSKSELLDHSRKTELTTVENTEKVLNAFCLWPRTKWDDAPKGFKKADLYPWRFGRQLSLVRRPLIQLDNTPNPQYVISPGLFGISIALTISRYFEAEIDATQCKSASMKRWIDDETNRSGLVFEIEVLEKLLSMGYEARHGAKVTGLVNDSLDQDYGDVDVLAWKPDGNALLVIECKNLRFAKTPNEIAEQLNRFSGQVLQNGDRDNLLKHVDRCNILKARINDVAKIIGLSNPNISLQNVVCFSKPVPMQYVASRFPDVSFVTIDNIVDILH
jgi:hypothetical protein